MKCSIIYLDTIYKYDRYYIIIIIYIVAIRRIKLHSFNHSIVGHTSNHLLTILMLCNSRAIYTQKYRLRRKVEWNIWSFIHSVSLFLLTCHICIYYKYYIYAHWWLMLHIQHLIIIPGYILTSSSIYERIVQIWLIRTEHSKPPFFLGDKFLLEWSLKCTYAFIRRCIFQNYAHIIEKPQYVCNICVWIVIYIQSIRTPRKCIDSLLLLLLMFCSRVNHLWYRLIWTYSLKKW